MLNTMGAKCYEIQLTVIKLFMIKENFLSQIVFN